MTSQKEQCPQGLCGVTIFRSVWGQLCQYREAFAILTTHLAPVLLPQPACCSVLYRMHDVGIRYTETHDGVNKCFKCNRE